MISGMMRMALVLVAAGAAMAMAAEAPKETPKGTASVYGAKCASCHGKDFKGNPAMAKMLKVELAALDLSDKETLAKSDAELIKIVFAGLGKMPAYKGKLSDEDVSTVLKEVRATGK